LRGGSGPHLTVVTVSNILTGAAGLADRKIEYFHQELAVGNAAGSLWQTAVVVSGGVTNTGGLVFPAGSQPMTYDLDGNLTFDGVWSYALSEASGSVRSGPVRVGYPYLRWVLQARIVE